MNVIIRHRSPNRIDVDVDSFDNVVSVEVQPADPDNRTQAERNAQNALDAARLARIEALLDDAIEGAEMVAGQGGKRVDVAYVLTILNEIKAAPVA